jgi:hypothetical protein
MRDFSFDGVHGSIEKEFGEILTTPITGEQEARAREYMASA